MENKICNGTYYNFKKGTEWCEKRKQCIFFKQGPMNPNDENRIGRLFNRVYQFRNCVLYKNK